MSRFTTVTRQGRVPATPAQITALVSSTAGFTVINPHLTQDPNLQITPRGVASGVGSAFAFRGKNGKGTQTVTDVTASSVEYAIDMGGMGQSRQRIDIKPDGAESIVTWSMTLDAGHNPLLRLFGLLAGKILGPSVEIGIRNLAAHDWAGKTVHAVATSAR
ncbi:SRPBCC family protein [Microbacterium xanthum]|uniref:SRPBCC family protein n=1 Tax=Microbacterium xanthum TaxID=3079794 RepID=UPI002AD2B15F|nr:MULTISPECIES: SRPBCC family protein [unclassified Microbacterium]MDZ8173213.1 SRPBCC family protein [Microbacterium sp. KSW-48]MDZ8200613.1 SRPBCC family protein [Microbacterium sp. SSW1-59]